MKNENGGIHRATLITLAIGLTLVGAAVAQVKISELPTATTISGSEAIPIVQGGITKTISATNLRTQFIGSGSTNITTLGTITNGPTTLAGYGITNAATNADLSAHTAATNNPHSVTASQVGLGNVENTALSTWTGSTNLTTTAVGTLATAATNSTGDFATAAQGALAATALQPGASYTNISGLGSLATQNGTFSGTSSGNNTGDQTISLSGDATGTGTGNITATLATVNSNVGSFGSGNQTATITVNGKGLVTAAGNVTISPASIGAATAAQGTLADSAVQPARTISTTAPLTGGGNLTGNLTLAISAASTNAVGAVQLATDAEIQTGTDTAKTVRPSGLAAWWAWIKTQAQTFAGAITLTGNLTAGDAAGDEFVANDDDPTFPNLTAATYTTANNTSVGLNGAVGDYRYSTGLPVIYRLQSTKVIPFGGWTTGTNGANSTLTQNSFLINPVAGTGAGAYSLAYAENRYRPLDATTPTFPAYASNIGYLFVGDFLLDRIGQCCRMLIGGASSNAVAGAAGSMDTNGLVVEINSQGTDTTYYLRLLTWEADAVVASSWVSFPASCRSVWVYYNRTASTFLASVYNASTSPPTLLVTRSGTIDDTPPATRGVQFVSCNDGSPASAGYIDLQQYILTTGIAP